MANQCTAQLNVTSITQQLTTCALADFRGFVVDSAPLFAGPVRVFNTTTNAVVTINNPGNVLVQGQQVCVTAGNISTVIPVSPGADFFSMEFLIDGVPVTTIIPFNARFTIEAAQFFINQAIIDPATVSITVDSFGVGLVVTIVKLTNVAVVTATVTLAPPPEGGGVFTSSFVCQIVPVVRRRRRRTPAGVLPSIDVAIPEGTAPADSVVYKGLTYTNPIVIYIDERSKIKKGFDIYRYTLNYSASRGPIRGWQLSY